MVGASVRGTSHEKSGQPCQDAHAWLVRPDGIGIIAVADGAGSAEFADIGATIAVKVAMESVAVGLDSGNDTAPLSIEDNRYKFILTDAVQAAKNAVEAEAISRKISPRALASTLIVVIACRGLVAAVQIGDGATVASAGSGNVFAVTTPKHGEYLNETTFLVSPNALSDMQLVIQRGDSTHVAVFSDGLQMLALKMPGNTPHSPFFSPLFNYLDSQTDPVQAQEALMSFLQSPRLRDRADDDLTLVLAAIVP